MSKLSLNDLISEHILGAEEAEDSATEDAVVKTASAKVPVALPTDDIEKLAGALDFVGRRGVESFMKTAEAVPNSPETNMGAGRKPHTQSQVAPHAGAPPMKEPGFGLLPSNAGKKPGGGKEVDCCGKQMGSSHKGLSSSEAATNVTKADKAKLVAPALDAVLDNTAFSDSKVKENLSHASSAGEKNFRKTASANDLEAIRVELARRAATAQERT